MVEIHPALIQQAGDDLRFMSNAGKAEREQWVLDCWCHISGRSVAGFVKGESPDFTSSNEAVEITEVLLPGRKRGDEYLTILRELGHGNLPEPTDVGDLQLVLNQAHVWIADAVSVKSQRYKSCANGWSLLVYANYPFCDRTRWDLARQRVASDTDFSAIHVLTANGEQVHTLKP